MAAGNQRLFASVRTRVLHPRVRHVVGFPPELADGADMATPLPWPDVLVIEEETQGNVFLYRLTRTGEPGGDTWHQSVEDARHQAEYEFGDLLDEWQDIPPEAADAREYAVATVQGKEADSA